LRWRLENVWRCCGGGGEKKRRTNLTFYLAYGPAVRKHGGVGRNSLQVGF